MMHIRGDGKDPAGIDPPTGRRCVEKERCRRNPVEPQFPRGQDGVGPLLRRRRDGAEPRSRIPGIVSPLA